MSDSPARDARSPLAGLTPKDLDASSTEELLRFLRGVRRYREELVLLHRKSVELHDGTRLTRRVTSWLVVFMVPTLLGGIYSANFHQPESAFVWAWPAFLALVAGSGIAMFAHLRRRGCV
ncbi:CorA family divalent cation transporter [Streptomyces sp. PvR034]|uniref:CorA family divalent cation transporter n=1 Tax=Streptomyces sp. PvR034 TaxID=3156401 RepID=UPI003394353F